MAKKKKEKEKKLQFKMSQLTEVPRMQTLDIKLKLHTIFFNNNI